MKERSTGADQIELLVSALLFDQSSLLCTFFVLSPPAESLSQSEHEGWIEARSRLTKRSPVGPARKQTGNLASVWFGPGENEDGKEKEKEKEIKTEFGPESETRRIG